MDGLGAHSPVSARSAATRQSNTAALDRRTALAMTGFVRAWRWPGHALYKACYAADIASQGWLAHWQRQCEAVCRSKSHAFCVKQGPPTGQQKTEYFFAPNKKAPLREQ